MPLSAGPSSAGPSSSRPLPAGPAWLCLLGGFDLTYDGQSLRVSTSAQRLLAHVAVTCRDRPVRRAALAERLWPDTSTSQATANLRSVLWRLPRPRGRQLVRCDTTTLRLSPDLSVDLWEAERLASLCCGPVGHRPLPDGDLAVLGEDLLPDWDDPWLEVERESYRQRRLHALESCAHRLREEGRYVDALGAGLAAVQSEPLRETAHRRVIEVHLAEGNQAEALRQFDGYRRMLRDELGIPPSPAIRELVAPLLGRPLDRSA